jgi:hypothetical protein
MAGIKTPSAAKRGRRRSKGFPRRATEGIARCGKPVGCAAAQVSRRSGFAARRSGYAARRSGYGQ